MDSLLMSDVCGLVYSFALGSVKVTVNWNKGVALLPTLLDGWYSVIMFPHDSIVLFL